MTRRLALLASALIALGAAAPPASAGPLIPVPSLFARPPAPSLAFVYRGFRVDARRTAKVQSPAKTARLIRAQIDLVYKAAPPPGVLAAMQAVPVTGDPATRPDGPDADYAPGRGVSLRVKGLDARRPVLLVGLLRAYQAERLPGGFANPEVSALRRAALARRAWPNTARMLQSDADFFALSAAAYLAGAITREPYTRADLRKTEPDTYRWLAQLFDGGRGRP